MGKEPVYDGDRCVGYVTSAAYGYTIGAGIAYAWLPDGAHRGGHAACRSATSTSGSTPSSTAEPLFDPEMTRLRS